MKIIIATIAALTAMGAFAGSAIADVSISLRFGSSPNYSSYRSNRFRTIAPSVPFYQNNFDRYRHNNNSSVIIRERPYYGNSWNYGTPTTIIQAPNLYNRHYNNYGDRYIIERKIIRVR